MKAPIKVLTQFGIIKPIKFINAHGGFNKNWIIISAQGKFILKQRPLKFLQRSIIEYKLCLYLKNKVVTAESIKSSQGKYLLKLNDYVYSLFRFIEGRKYKNNNSDLKKVAKSMALFHISTRDFPCRNMNFNKNMIDWLHSLLNTYNGIHKNDFQKLVELSIQNIQKVLDLKQTVIHGDIHPGNLLIVKKQAVFFDYEFAHHDYRIFDIANTLSILTGLDLTKVDYHAALSFIRRCKLNLGKTRNFIDTYNKYSPLSSNEVEILADASVITWIAWSLYTIIELKPTDDIIKKALYYPLWIHKNRLKIIKALLI